MRATNGTPRRSAHVCRRSSLYKKDRSSTFTAVKSNSASGLMRTLGRFHDGTTVISPILLPTHTLRALPSIHKVSYIYIPPINPTLSALMAETSLVTWRELRGIMARLRRLHDILKLFRAPKTKPGHWALPDNIWALSDEAESITQQVMSGPLHLERSWRPPRISLEYLHTSSYPKGLH